MSGIDFDAIPGFVNRRDQHGETTITIETERIVEAGTYVRDELGFTFLADLAGADYLGWGEKGVAGYWGTPPADAERGWTPPARDINAPGSWGLQTMPDPKPMPGVEAPPRASARPSYRPPPPTAFWAESRASACSSKVVRV